MSFFKNLVNIQSDHPLAAVNGHENAIASPQARALPRPGSYTPKKNAGGDYVIINGRRVPAGNGISGMEISARAAHHGRRAVALVNGRAVMIDRNRFYSGKDLQDSRGNPIKITSIPDRTKGGDVFQGSRDEYSKAIITEQVLDVAAMFARGNVDFDETDADWLVFPQFHLPDNWEQRTAPLMIIFPRQYPVEPPIGFYLPASLKSPNGHFYNTVYHGAAQAPVLKDWNWYCCTVNPGQWRPHPVKRSGDWRLGDNLWTYITLINEILASPESSS